MKKILFLSCIYFLLIILASCKTLHILPSRPGIYENTEQMLAVVKRVITEINQEDFKKLYDRGNLFIVDIRTREEWKEGCIPGSVLIPRGVLEFRITSDYLWSENNREVPGKDDTIVLYCGGGNRSALAAKSLMELGYVRVKSLEGGWRLWHENHPELVKYPTE